MYQKLFGIFLVFPLSVIFAKPTLSEIHSGDVKIAHPNSQHMEIIASDKAIIHWKDFSIAKNEGAKFIQPHSSASVLNRVIENNPSSLLGQLESNGKVFLINPAGIVIGKDAIINTASFIASTLDVSNDDYMKNSAMFFHDTTKAKIVNLGRIQAWDGDVFLISYNIDNQGTIEAKQGQCHLVAGQEIILHPAKEEKIFIKTALSNQEKDDETIGINNTGTIQAVEAYLHADGNTYALAMNLEGEIQATGFVQKEGRVFITAEKGRLEAKGNIIAKNENDTGGKIHLLAEEVVIKDHAVIDVSSNGDAGEILIGGDFQGKNPDIYNSLFTYIGNDVNICADSLQEGNGGRVIIWSNDQTKCFGNISAKGGNTRGDGGFIEISSAKNLQYQGKAHASAFNGLAGTILYDPSDINIANYGGISNPAYPTSPGPPTDIYDPTGLPSPAELDVVNIVNSLNGGTNVTIQTGSGTMGSGIVQVINEINWSSVSPVTLEIRADADIIVSAPIRDTGQATNVILYSTMGNINVYSNVEISTGTVTGMGMGTLVLAAEQGNIQIDKGCKPTSIANIDMQANNGQIFFNGDPMDQIFCNSATEQNYTAANITINNSTIKAIDFDIGFNANVGDLQILGSDIQAQNQGLNYFAVKNVHLENSTHQSAYNIYIKSQDSTIDTVNTNILGSTLGVNIVNFDAYENIICNGTNIESNMGFIELIAGQDLVFYSTSASANQNLTIRVDNRYPSSPQIGSGQFIFDAGSQLTTPAELRIYTAIFPQNTISGQLNGSFYTGVEDVEDPQNQYGYYYPSGSFTAPYTVFFKRETKEDPVPPDDKEKIEKVVTEELDYLHLYDTGRIWTRSFSLSYEADNNWFVFDNPKIFSSFNVQDEDEYFLPQRKYLELKTKTLNPETSKLYE